LIPQLRDLYYCNVGAVAEEIQTETTQYKGPRIWFWVCCFVAFLALDAVGFFWWKSRPERRYDDQIRMAGARYGLDPALIKAVIWQESHFRADAVGRAGEIGLMQVREDAAFEWAEAEKLPRFDHKEIRDPQKNIYAGTFYLSKLLRRYKKADNPLPYALADYNAGRSHVLRWNKGAAQTNSSLFLAQMDYPGTKQYALNIMDRYAYYKDRFH
jgi:soluble lytic murein transglycosylase